MATDDQQVLVVGKASAPAHFTIPGNGQIRPKAIYAQFDGTAAGTVYTPALQIISDAGKVVGIYRTTQAVAAGGSAVVSWFPGADLDDASATGGGGGGTIQNIVSPGATIAVTAPSGPTTSLDLPVSGVAAGSYGDSSHSAQVTVDVEGRITAATSVGIAGGSGTIGFEIGYDQITANVNIGSTSEGAPTTIITCGAHTFDGAPVLLTFFTPFIQTATGAFGPVTVALWEGSTEISRIGFTSISGTTIGLAVGTTFNYRFTPTAASHTYLIRASAGSLTGTPLIGAGTGSGAAYPPAFARFTKV